MTHTNAYLDPHRWLVLTPHQVADWQYAVANGDTQLGLADWYLAQAEDHVQDICGATEIQSQRQQIIDRLNAETALEEDRCHLRSKIITDLFYDDDGSDAPIRDALNDLHHFADKLGFDFEQALSAAERIYRQELIDFAAERRMRDLAADQ